MLYSPKEVYAKQHLSSYYSSKLKHPVFHTRHDTISYVFDNKLKDLWEKLDMNKGAAGKKCKLHSHFLTKNNTDFLTEHVSSIRVQVQCDWKKWIIFVQFVLYM
jgi:hypothetical protein